jgi:chromosome partitioning protein
MSHVIAVVNQKGGVGKTTTCVNLAASIALRGKKVLILDLDPQGNASTSLGIEEKKNRMYHFLIGEESFENVVSKTAISFLDIIPTDNSLVGAEVELVSSFAREAKLKEAMKEIPKSYDYIFIDCPPSLGLLTVNALTASQGFIVPMQTEYFAMEGLSQLLNTVKLMQKSLNPRLSLIGIVFTMYDIRNNLTKLVSEDLRKYFKNQIFKTVIPRNVKLSEAPSFGKPICLYDVKSKGSLAYVSLSKEFMHRMNLQKEVRC